MSRKDKQIAYIDGQTDKKAGREMIH